jgi:hypothetical protein
VSLGPELQARPKYRELSLQNLQYRKLKLQSHLQQMGKHDLLSLFVPSLHFRAAAHTLRYIYRHPKNGFSESGLPVLGLVGPPFPFLTSVPQTPR